MQSDDDYETPEAISQAIDLFHPPLVDSLAKMLVGPDLTTAEYTLDVGTQRRTSSTGDITALKVTRLKQYVKFIREHFYAEDQIDVAGAIVELRSRDPEGNRNHIVITTDFHGDRTFVSATLNNAQYQIAVNAHGAKREVRLVGRGMRLKTQVRITDVVDFR